MSAAQQAADALTTIATASKPNKQQEETQLRYCCVQTAQTCMAIGTGRGMVLADDLITYAAALYDFLKLGRRPTKVRTELRVVTANDNDRKA